MSMRERRGTIALEEAAVIEHRACAADQFVLRLHAPVTAQRARPGQFVHLQCADDFPLRRPLSIMRADPAGWIEVLYKPVGAGLRALTQRKVNETLSMLGPIGNGFDWSSSPRRILALGGGVGIPPMVFAAQELHTRNDISLIVYMGSEIPFPFELTTTRLDVPGIDSNGCSNVALLEQWGVAGVLTSNADLAGCHRGYVTELADRTLAQLPADELEQTLMLACGPEPMLAATAQLAARYRVPCQLALEEYMACGVGGCAGCAVEVHTNAGIRMQRVCVDGPVFDAVSIYPTD